MRRCRPPSPISRAMKVDSLLEKYEAGQQVAGPAEAVMLPTSKRYGDDKKAR